MNYFLENFMTPGLSDTDAFEHALNAAKGNNLYCQANQAYTIVRNLTVECNLFLNNSTVTFNLNGSEECFTIKSYSSLQNGKIVNYGVNFSGAGNFQCPIVIGNYGTGASEKNIILNNLVISNNRPDGNGIVVTGASHNIEIKNIEFLDSLHLGRAILVHWGGANLQNNLPVNGTFHPFNVTIDNIKIGRMGYSLVTGAGGITISGAYNVKVSNVHAKEIKWHHGLFKVFAGDYGVSQLNNKALENLILTNIIIENCSVETAYGKLGDIECKKTRIDHNNYASPLEGKILNGPTIKNIYGGAHGANLSAGISVSFSKNCVINNCYIDGFYLGISTGQRVSNLLIEGGEIYNSKIQGISFSNGSYPPTHCKAINVTVYNNGKDLGNHAGIYLGKSENCIVESCFIGKENETQTYGVRVDNHCINGIVMKNYVAEALVSAYSIGSSNTLNVISKFKDNLSAKNIKLYQTGVSPIIIESYFIENTNKEIRIFLGREEPTFGNWKKGDRIMNNFINSSSNLGWVCIQSGTPGIWRSF